MVKSQIRLQEVKKAVQKLSLKDRAKLIEELQKDTWKEQFKQLLKRIDERVKKHPISQKEINAICEEARQEYYEKTRGQGRH